ncbi:MAG: YbaN family protein [Wenzhouxiangellaceae bacterium]|nr:YbaN family protein [Wenzhouxiangellaceae bacterium]
MQATHSNHSNHSETAPNSAPGWRMLAVSAAGVGALGALLPLLPTTPFLLIALSAASRSSPELHRRILEHRRFGPLIEAWQAERAVPTRAKLVAGALMAASWITLWLTGAGTGLMAAITLLFVAVAAFLLSRPAPGSNGRRAA